MPGCSSEWLGPGFAADWIVMPQLRGRAYRGHVRQLGTRLPAARRIVVCSFGLTDLFKLNIG